MEHREEATRGSQGRLLWGGGVSAKTQQMRREPAVHRAFRRKGWHGPSRLQELGEAIVVGASPPGLGTEGLLGPGQTLVARG